MTRLVRSSAVKLVPVERRKGAAPLAAGVRRRVVSLFTISVAMACFRLYNLVAMTSSCGRSSWASTVSIFCRFMIESVTRIALFRLKKTGGVPSVLLSIPWICKTTSWPLACLSRKILEATRPLGGRESALSLSSVGDSALATLFGTTLRNLSPCWMTATPFKVSNVSMARSASLRVAVAGSERV